VEKEPIEDIVGPRGDGPNPPRAGVGGGGLLGQCGSKKTKGGGSVPRQQTSKRKGRERPPKILTQTAEKKRSRRTAKELKIPQREQSEK